MGFDSDFNRKLKLESDIEYEEIYLFNPLRDFRDIKISSVYSEEQDTIKVVVRGLLNGKAYYHALDPIPSEMVARVAEALTETVMTDRQKEIRDFLDAATLGAEPIKQQEG